MPFLSQFIEPDAEFPPQQVHRVLRIVSQYLMDIEELRLVVRYHTGIWRNGYLAVSEGIQGIDCLVRGHVIRKMDDYLRPVGCQVIYLLYLYLAFVFSLQYRFDQKPGSLAERNLGDGYRVLVYLFNLGPYFYRTATSAPVVSGAVSKASGREVRIQFEWLVLQYCNGCVDKFVEIVRKNLRCQTYCYPFCSLGEQKRELDRQFYRFLVPAVIGVHPFCGLGVEKDFLCQPAQFGFNIPRCCIGVACEYVPPVALAVYEHVLLPELDKSPLDGGISMRVEFHGFTDNRCHFDRCAVIYPVQCMKDAPLHGLETVCHVRYSPLEDNI